MKRLAWLGLALLLALQGIAADRRTKINAYKMNLKLDSAGRVLHVQALLSLENRDTSELNLHFAGIITIRRFSSDGDTVAYRRSQDGLHFRLPNLRKCKLSLDYDLETDSFKTDRVIALVRGRKWVPYLFDNVASTEIELTVPARYYAYSSGKQSNYEFDGKNRRSHFTVKVNAGMPLFIAPVDYYTGQTCIVHGTQLNFFFHHADTVRTNTVVRESIRAFVFGNRFVGKYKPSTFTYIEFPEFEFCQSMPGFVLMGPEYISNVNKVDKRYWVGHETLHQWVGNGYFTALYNHSPYSRFIEEALTEYLRMVSLQQTFGEDTLRALLRENCRIYHTYIKNTVEDVPVAVNRPNWVTYTVGPIIWHLVRQEMGIKRWRQFLRKIYSKYYGKVIDYSVFRLQLVKFASEGTVQKMEHNLQNKGIPGEFIE